MNTHERLRKIENLSFQGVVLSLELETVEYELEGLRGLLSVNQLERKLELQERKRTLLQLISQTIEAHKEFLGEHDHEYVSFLFPNSGENIVNPEETSVYLIGRPFTKEYAMHNAHSYYKALISDII